MLSKPLVLLGLLIMIASCGPLVPIYYEDGKSNNRLTQSIETGDATVWLRYLQSQNGYMVFDLEIANRSPFEMEVAPQQISFYASSRTFIPIQTGAGDDVHALSGPNSTLTMRRQFASDPSSIQRFYMQKAKSKKVEAGIFTVLLIGAIVFDAAQDSKTSHKESFTSKDAWKSFGTDALVTTALVANDLAHTSAKQTEEESYYLPYELFPECTIKAGRNVRGKIFLPIESHEKYLRVVVPLDDSDYVFDFKRLPAGANQYH